MRKPAFLAATAALFAPAAIVAQPAPPPDAPPGGFPNMPAMADYDYDIVLEIADGAIVGQPETADGAISTTLIEGLTLASNVEGRNGILVAGGRSAVTLRDAQVRIDAPGTNDFLGTGAGVMARDEAALVLDRVDIETTGRIAPALVAAEHASVHIYNSRLVTNGGPLPEDYVPVIGPGMMEPPAPLGLEGTARTLLAMSNSRTIVHNSHIEADGWGAASTDATGGNLYLEINDSTIKVRRDGYGTYADFGATVVVNNSRIDSGGPMGIIAGKASTTYSGVTGTAAENAIMIHSVMAFDPAEEAEFTLSGSRVQTGESAILVKSANARISVADSTITSASGVLLEVRKNEDPNATQTNGRPVPGVHLTVEGSQLAGNMADSDPDRETFVTLAGSRLAGALDDIVFSADASSAWLATADSLVTLADAPSLATIDAPAGVTIAAKVGSSGLAPGTRTLASGGVVILERD